MNESKKYAHSWNVTAFFKIVCQDITKCLSQLDTLKLHDHSLIIEKGGLREHVRVCTLMRAKLVSEVEENVRKLRVRMNRLIAETAEYILFFISRLNDPDVIFTEYYK